MSDTLLEAVVEGRMVVHHLCRRCEHKRNKLDGRVQGTLTLRQLVPRGVLHWSSPGEAFRSICHAQARHR